MEYLSVHTFLLLYSVPQMLKPTNYFSLLNLPTSFNIDKDTLKQKYYLQAKRYHPSTSNFDNDKESKEKESVFLGLKKAYDVLRDDLSRAMHLKSLRKEPAEKLPGKEESPVYDTNELMSFFNLSERLNNNEKSAKKDLTEKIKECKKFYYDPLYLRRWKYYDNMEKRMKEKEINEI